MAKDVSPSSSLLPHFYDRAKVSLCALFMPFKSKDLLSFRREASLTTMSLASLFHVRVVVVMMLLPKDSSPSRKRVGRQDILLSHNVQLKS
jgi:hypothetical protein